MIKAELLSYFSKLWKRTVIIECTFLPELAIIKYNSTDKFVLCLSELILHYINKILLKIIQ